MNQITSLLISPLRAVSHLWQYRYLIFQLTRRELVGRYRGSFLGIAWSAIYPLMMLAVYTFVFSVVFQAKWGAGLGNSRLGFAMNLFMGILTFNLFGETTNMSPTVILANVNYVKKVVFPLEVLPVVTFLGVLINNVIGLCVLVAGLLVVNHTLPVTALMLPLVWFPVMLFSLGCAYFMASLGVFVRDVESAIVLVTTILFFLSPVFYPVSAVPPRYRTLIQINPLAIYIRHAREVMLWGKIPDWRLYFAGLVLGILVFSSGFLWFKKSKKGFADVI